MERLAHLRPHKRRRGSTLVEFTLVLPMLVSLFLGTLAFGWDYFIYSELEDAVRAGARYASLAGYDASAPATYQTAAQNMVVYGNPAGGTNPLALGLSTANVNVTVNFTGAFPTSVSVSITGYSFPLNLLKITLTGKPVDQFPYLGNWAPA